MGKFKEDDLQMAVAKYLDLKGVLWCHVANERRTSIQAGRRLKNKGVKSGVPDVMIFSLNCYYNGLAIELKIKPNKTTANQDYWLKHLKGRGWKTAVCYDFDQAKLEIDNYLNI